MSFKTSVSIGESTEQPKVPVYKKKRPVEKQAAPNLGWAESVLINEESGLLEFHLADGEIIRVETNRTKPPVISARISIGGDMIFEFQDGTEQNIGVLSGLETAAVQAVQDVLDDGLVFTWDVLANKPVEFPPEAHTHTILDITDLQTELDALQTSINTLDPFPDQTGVPDGKVLGLSGGAKAWIDGVPQPLGQADSPTFNGLTLGGIEVNDDAFFYGSVTLDDALSVSSLLVTGNAKVPTPTIASHAATKEYVDDYFDQSLNTTDSPTFVGISNNLDGEFIIEPYVIFQSALEAENVHSRGTVTAPIGNFGALPSPLRAFNVKGAGLDGRLSIQGGPGDNPGVELTTNNNFSRVLLRMAEVGAFGVDTGTELQIYTEPEGGDITQAMIVRSTGDLDLLGNRIIGAQSVNTISFAADGESEFYGYVYMGDDLDVDGVIRGGSFILTDGTPIVPVPQPLDTTDSPTFAGLTVGTDGWNGTHGAIRLGSTNASAGMAEIRGVYVGGGDHDLSFITVQAHTESQVMRITGDGYVGIQTSDETATLNVHGHKTDSLVLNVRAAAGQTEDVFRVEDSVGGTLLSVDANGNTAMGAGSAANGLRSISAGFQSETLGNYSFAIGRNSSAYGSYSLVIGSFIQANTTDTVTIGKGVDANNRLSVSSGIGLGVNSTIPTLTVTKAAGLDTFGNVLIGTTTDTGERLQVAGSDNETVLALQHSDVGFGSFINFLNSGGLIVGAINKQGFYRAPSGTVNGVSFSFLSDANTGFYNPNADNLAFVTGGVERLLLDDAGTTTVKKATGQTADVFRVEDSVGGVMFFIDAAGAPSAPHTGSESERFGAGSNAGGMFGTVFGYAATDNDFDFSTVVGRTASVTGNSGSAFGQGATAGFSAVALGRGASAPSNSGVAIGYSASASDLSFALGGFTVAGDNAIAIGANANADGGSIVLGRSATSTIGRQFVVGSNTYGWVDNGYFGSGVIDPTPTDFTLNATGGEGTDIAGADFTLAGGRGTGAAAGGNVIFSTAAASGTTGTAPNPLIERARITAAGNLLVGTTTDTGERLQVAGDATANNLTLTRDNYGVDSIHINADNPNGTTYTGTALSVTAFGSTLDLIRYDGQFRAFGSPTYPAYTFAADIESGMFPTGGGANSGIGFVASLVTSLTVKPNDVTAYGALTVQAATGQTADVFRVEDSVGGSLLNVTENGSIYATNAQVHIGNDRNTDNRFGPLRVKYMGSGEVGLESTFGADNPVNFGGFGFYANGAIATMSTVASGGGDFVLNRDNADWNFLTSQGTNFTPLSRFRVGGGANATVIVDNANLLVGTTTDTGEKLQVAGDLRVQSDVTWGNPIASFTNPTVGRGVGGSGLEIQGFYAGRPRIVPTFEDGSPGDRIVLLGAAGQDIDIVDANRRISASTSGFAGSGNYLGLSATVGVHVDGVLEVENDDSALTALTVQAATGQTADVFRVEDSVGSPLVHVNSAGTLVFRNRTGVETEPFPFIEVEGKIRLEQMLPEANGKVGMSIKSSGSWIQLFEAKSEFDFKVPVIASSGFKVLGVHNFSFEAGDGLHTLALKGRNKSSGNWEPVWTARSSEDDRAGDYFEVNVPVTHKGSLVADEVPWNMGDHLRLRRTADDNGNNIGDYWLEAKSNSTWNKVLRASYQGFEASRVAGTEGFRLLAEWNDESDPAHGYLMGNVGGSSAEYEYRVLSADRIFKLQSDHTNSYPTWSRTPFEVYSTGAVDSDYALHRTQLRVQQQSGQTADVFRVEDSVGGTRFAVEDDSVRIDRNNYAPGLIIESNGYTTEAISIQQGGIEVAYVGYTGNFVAKGGTQAAPGFAFDDNTNTGMGADSALWFSVNGDYRAQITQDDDFELLNAGGGIIMKSLNTTRRRITSRDDGGFDATDVSTSDAVIIPTEAVMTDPAGDRPNATRVIWKTATEPTGSVGFPVQEGDIWEPTA